MSEKYTSILDPEPDQSFDQYYDARLSEYLQATPDVWNSLGTPENIWMNDAVVYGTAKYAQTAHGDAIIAAKALRYHGIDGLRQLRDFAPERDMLTERVHNIHTAMGVPYLPSSQEICSSAGNFAVDAVEAIYIMAARVAESSNVPLPESLQATTMHSGVHARNAWGPWSLNREAATQLLNFLSSNEQIAELTSGLLQAQSGMLLKDSRAHTNYLQAQVVPLKTLIRTEPGGSPESTRALVAVQRIEPIIHAIGAKIKADAVAAYQL